MEEYTFGKPETSKHFSEIIALQKANLSTAISPKSLMEEGFVTVKHTKRLLEEMHSFHPHSVVFFKGVIVGYALSMHTHFAERVDTLIPFFKKLESFYSSDVSYLVMGQICIAKPHRKKGLFRALYSHQLQNVTPNMQWVVTEVDRRNTRSLNAHKAIGFRHLFTYRIAAVVWDVIALYP